MVCFQCFPPSVLLSSSLLPLYFGFLLRARALPAEPRERRRIEIGFQGFCCCRNHLVAGMENIVHEEELMMLMVCSSVFCGRHRGHGCLRSSRKYKEIKGVTLISSSFVMTLIFSAGLLRSRSDAYLFCNFFFFFLVVYTRVSSSLGSLLSAASLSVIFFFRVLLVAGRISTFWTNWQLCWWSMEDRVQQIPHTRKVFSSWPSMCQSNTH